MMNPTIEIVLSTYNGGRYLREQLDSIVGQTFTEWSLLIRDDASSDDTLEIVSEYVERYRGKIRLVEPPGKNLGACQSFARLLEFAEADYIMFCDQDDVWLPEKISLTLTKIQELKEVHGVEIPLLVHTDLRVVDESLNLVAESGHGYQKIDPDNGNAFGRLLVQNIATGCTTMMNRTLRDRALPIPAAALMHDHWLSLVASCFGKIAYLPTPTLLYRQHVKNKVGAQGWNTVYAAKLLFQLPAIRQIMIRNRMQAKAFCERYHSTLRDRDKALLEAFIDMPERGFLQKRRDIFNYGFFYAGALRNIGWLLLC